jgi:HNH endonuclease
MKAGSILSRFQAKYVVDDSGCWLWTGALNDHGYGWMSTTRKDGPDRAHRIAWRLFKGPIPEGLYVLHRCDTPRCVNPNHLFLGTQTDNNADKEAKGRGTKPPLHLGEKHPRAKFTEAEIKEIRRRKAVGETFAKLGAVYSVSWMTIFRIVHRQTWAHVA